MSDPFYSALRFELESELEHLKQQHLYRSPDIVLSKRSGRRLDHCVDFSSNDYLGLAQHPRVIAETSKAAKRWGTGSGASRLLSGNFKIHVELERELALFKHEAAALVFSSGYLANLGVIRTLVNEKDLVVLDRLVHASLVDGARLSKAKMAVYAHRDVEALEKVLKRSGNYRRRLVLTDAYFSMDGTVAPLDELFAVCQRYEALLMVDEAHSTGVYGRTGRGLTEQFCLSGKIPVVMGTLSKALGSVGGFIAGSSLLRETLVNHCREFIYTTGPSPAASAAALASLRLIKKKPGLREKLWSNIRYLRSLMKENGFDLMSSEGPVLPVLIADAKKTIHYKEALKKRGFWVSAIRPPTVPRQTERLRISVSAAHTPAQIRALAEAMKKVVQ